MKHLKPLLSAAILTGGMIMSAVMADNLVILHTNDTHSLILPDDKGRGGVLQRKAIIDSVRAANPNVILVDAGDNVQGTLFFTYFRGDVEYPLLDMQGYDIHILGNHEFDNGIDELAEHYKKLGGTALSANYDFTGTPLEGVFQPYVIKEVDGKKIGFIGLNVDPTSLISKGNTVGMKFNPVIETANRVASFLKHDEGCDLVVAVTHIGYTDEDHTGKEVDVDLAAQSSDIDIIIGGHSHTVIDPAHPEVNPSRFTNADGKEVLVAQTGKYGKYIGEINIDLNDLNPGADNVKGIKSQLIPVTNRFAPEQLDSNIIRFLQPYRQIVDSISGHVIAQSRYDLDSDDRNGGYANFVGDFARWYGQHKADSLALGKVDMGLMNVGGIRHNMPKGDVTKGEILATFPFGNRMLLLDIKGSDLIAALQASANKGGESVSGNVRVVVGQDSNIAHALIDMKDIDPEKQYIVSTIDYLAEGNDELRTLANGTVIWKDDVPIEIPMLKYVMMHQDYGMPIAPDLNGRFIYLNQEK